MSHDHIGMDLARHAGERASEAMMHAIRLCESPGQASMVAFHVLGVVAAQAAGVLSKTYGVKLDGDAVSMLEMLTEIMREVSTDQPQLPIRARKGG